MKGIADIVAKARTLSSIASALVFFLATVAVVALAFYDYVAVRPQLPRIERILAQADPLDANPPEVIRRLIDASMGSPTAHATRLATSRFYVGSSQGEWHLRNALWSMLLPLHLGKDKMYGLYATLAFNGRDQGLSRFAARVYGKPLDRLSPNEAAVTVEMTRMPTIYRRNPDKLVQRAAALASKAENASKSRTPRVE